jgi:hypothetical protein
MGDHHSHINMYQIGCYPALEVFLISKVIYTHVFTVSIFHESNASCSFKATIPPPRKGVHAVRQWPVDGMIRLKKPSMFKQQVIGGASFQ